MTPDQEEMWKTLSNDAAYLCHKWAKELLALKGRKFHQQCDERLGYITNNFDNESATSIIKTWLSSYAIPLDPSKLKNFDNFHMRFGRYISDNVKDIRIYK